MLTRRSVLYSVWTEAAVEEVSVHGEEFWLFGGVGSEVPLGGSPSAVAMVIVVTGIGCT